MKAVILAGGLGTRLRPFTDVIPKPLLPLGDKSIIEIQIGALAKAGVTDVYVATNYLSHIIEAYVGDGSRLGVRVHISREEQPLGTAGPIRLIGDALDEPFIMMNGDIITKLDFKVLYDFAVRQDSCLTVATKIVTTPFRFGNVFVENDKITGVDEKPDFNLEILAGIYCMKPEIMRFIPEAVYFGMDSLIKRMLAEKQPISRYLIKEYWLDIGQVEDYSKARELYGQGGAGSSNGKRFIPLSVPEIRGNEWSYIKECLDTNWISYVGPFVERFEKDLAERCGAEHAVATASGTSALHLALLLAGVDSDSEVVMPAITFVAPANAVRYCGAWPTFIDIRQSDWQMDIAKLADFLRKDCTFSSGQVINKATGRRVSALLPVHLMGDMCDVDAVLELATEFCLPVVEDAAECGGATYKNRGIGAASPAADNITRLICTSFNGNKIVTTGGGGALLTNDAALARRAKHISTTAKADPIAFYHDDIGYNYRLNNVCAALGVAQLEKLNEYVAIKRRIAARYAEAFAGTQAITPHAASTHADPTYWLYTVMLDRPARPVVDALNADGIQSRPIWVPMHKLPMFTSCWRHSSEFAEQFHEHALSLPCSVGLSTDDLAFSAEKVLEHTTADIRIPVVN